MRRLIFMVLFVLSVGIYPGWGFAASKVWVTDVKPSGFSLVWTANQAASCSAKVYADPEGKEPIPGLNITSDSANNPPAEQNGVMKVDVYGLAPGRTYYFQTITTSDKGMLIEPAVGPLPAVQTESSSQWVSNDVLAHRILLRDGSTPAVGALLVVHVEGASYPITGWVGNSPANPPPWVFVDLSQIYSKTHHRNLELSGGEEIVIESVGGFMGFRRLLGVVPAEIPGDSGRTTELVPRPGDELCTLIREILPPRGLRIAVR